MATGPPIVAGYGPCIDRVGLNGGGGGTMTFLGSKGGSGLVWCERVYG